MKREREVAPLLVFRFDSFNSLHIRFSPILPVTIECVKDSIKFSANGDLGSGSIQIKQGASVDEKKGVDTTIALSTAVTATYSLKYLNNFTKATSLSDTVTLSISNELPVVVEYKVSELGYIR